MDKMISRFPEQLEEALQLAENASFTKHNAAIRTVLICGLGGSGIGGNFVQDLTGAECKVPIIVNKG